VASTKALAFQPRARGNRIALIGNGIGTIVQALDILGTSGLQLASLAPETLKRLRDVYPPFYVIQNPLDVTGSGTSEDYRVGLQALLDDPGVDLVMPWFVFQDAPLDEDVVDKLAALDYSGGKPILGAAMGGDYTDHMIAQLESRGIPMMRSPTQWVAAASALTTRDG
jgi:3-hydroxypropionyl-CoA synthetase (ADP-forming)